MTRLHLGNAFYFFDTKKGFALCFFFFFQIHIYFSQKTSEIRKRCGAGLKSIMHLYSRLLFQWCHTSSLKLAMVGVFTPQKLANATDQGHSHHYPVYQHVTGPATWRTCLTTQDSQPNSTLWFHRLCGVKQRGFAGYVLSGKSWQNPGQDHGNRCWQRIGT